MANLGGFEITGLNDVRVTIETMIERGKNFAPAMNAITAEFGLMEEEVFKGGGISTTFGVHENWGSLADKTLAKRDNPNDQPLINRGYLFEAATSPRIETFAENSLRIIIDPRNKRASDSYSEKENYGFRHQIGANRPERVFVDITEKFMLIADEIVSQYLLEDIRTKPSRVNSNAAAYAKAVRKNNKEHRIHMKEANKVKAERRSREGRAPIDDRPMTYGEWAHTVQPKLTAEQHEKALASAKDWRSRDMKSQTELRKIEPERFAVVQQIESLAAHYRTYTDKKR